MHLYMFQEEAMRKQMAKTIAVLVAGLWLAAAVSAQGRSQGGPPAGVGGGGGAHGSLGLPGSERSGSSGHGSPYSAAAKPLGPLSSTSLLDQNSKLAANLTGFFPPGTDIPAQAAGFKNLGQF